jgi:hypothetical protein
LAEIMDCKVISLMRFFLSKFIKSSSPTGT